MPKRGENIYKRKDGRWEGRIRKNVCLQGERKYKSVYGKTYHEVRRKMDTVRMEMAASGNICTISMEEAANIWLKDKGCGWKETTYAAYWQIVKKYILPYLGGMTLLKIDDRVMEAFVCAIQKRKGEEKLTKTYLSYICGIVQRVMIYIRKKNNYELTIPGNPVSRDRKAKIMPPGHAVLSKLEGYLLENTENDTCLGILIALHTGMRIGELCALSWKDIDFDEGVIHVRNNIQRVRNFDGQKNKTKLILLNPKTVDSMRDIPIPSILFNILQSCKKQPLMPVVSGVKSIRLDPRTLQYRFKKILKTCGIEYFNFHVLRHAFATRCIEKGFDIKSLSEILGHSNIQITLNLYVHSSLKQKKQLMNLFGSYSMEEHTA